ncbi:MAG TPA: sugar ABC transporter substrate-binding protein [Planctomycetota bacterium]|nr:sugar ABC transporter substrate-binding protein [Planctomycetota bacterium]
MTMRNAFRWLCALALASMLAGCSSEEPPPDGGKPRYRVALVMKSLANEFFKTMEDGARAHARKDPSRYELISNGIKDERDVNGQIAIVEQMIAQKVNALVIAPADSKALVPVCKRAADAGIVVVNIDNELDEKTLEEKGTKIPFVGPNNRLGARSAGDYLAKRLKPGDTVAIVEGMPGADNGTMRKMGFEAAMNAAEIKVAASQTGYWETDKAEKAVSGMLTQHPDLKGILCANDSMALGAVAALKAAGKLGSVLVVGYDNISAIQELILDGRVLCTVDQHADQIAVEGIRHALDILDGHVPPEQSDRKQTKVDLIDAEALKRKAAEAKATEGEAAEPK